MTCDKCEGVLRDIFGKDYDNLSEGEMNVAVRVASYFVTPSYDPDQRLLDACKYAVLQEGMTWDEVVLSRSKQRQYVDLRYCIFSVFFSLCGKSQIQKTRLLGGVYDRCTILHGLKQVQEWSEYDAAFRQRLQRITDNVKNYLKDE